MRKLHIKYPFTIQVSQGWPGLRFHILITGQPGMRPAMMAHCLHGRLGAEGGISCCLIQIIATLQISLKRSPVVREGQGGHDCITTDITGTGCWQREKWLLPWCPVCLLCAITRSVQKLWFTCCSKIQIHALRSPDLRPRTTSREQRSVLPN